MYFWPEVQAQMAFIDFSIFSSGSHFSVEQNCLGSLNIGAYEQYLCEIIWHLGACSSGGGLKMSLFLALVVILLYGAEPFGQFGRGPFEEHGCQIILYLGQHFRKRCCLKIPTFYLWWPSYLAEQNQLDNFGRSPYEEHLHIGHKYQIIFNLGQLFRRRCLQKIDACSTKTNHKRSPMSNSCSGEQKNNNSLLNFHTLLQILCMSSKPLLIISLCIVLFSLDISYLKKKKNYRSRLAFD